MPRSLEERISNVYFIISLLQLRKYLKKIRWFSGNATKIQYNEVQTKEEGYLQHCITVRLKQMIWCIRHGTKDMVQ